MGDHQMAGPGWVHRFGGEIINLPVFQVSLEDIVGWYQPRAILLAELVNGLEVI
jgi:hypothetical protein